MGIMGKHGINSDTPKNVPLGAGTIHKGLKYVKYTKNANGTITIVANSATETTTSKHLETIKHYCADTLTVGDKVNVAASPAWNGESTIIGATSGGNKLTIKGEIKNLDLDGAWVNVKGCAVMQGGTATMEVNYGEINEEILKEVLIGELNASEITGYNEIKPKVTIEEWDYIEDFAYVGQTADGSKKIIVIFDYGLCTSGLTLEGKSKDQGVIAATVEAYADNSGDLNTIPVRIYYPS